MKKIMIIFSAIALVMIFFWALSDKEKHGLKFNDVLYEVFYYNINDERFLEKAGIYLSMYKSIGLEEKKRKQLEEIFSSYDLLNGGTDQKPEADIDEYIEEDKIIYSSINNSVYEFSLKIKDDPFVLSFHIVNSRCGCFYLSRIGKIKNGVAFTLYEKVEQDGTVVIRYEGVRHFTYPGLDKELAQFLVENCDTIDDMIESSDSTIWKYPLPIEWMRLLFEKISKYIS